MRPLKNHLIGIFALLTVTGTAVGIGAAQEYPTRPISIIVTYTAGGQTDMAGRLIANGLAEKLNQTATVVNKPGAGGAIGTAELAAAKADGYTLGIATSTPFIQRPLTSETPYTYKDFEYICRVNHDPLFFVVRKGSDIKTVDDLIEKAQSGERLTYGSSGEASIQHIAMTSFTSGAGIDMVHVPNSSDTNNIRSILSGVLTGTLVTANVVASNEDVQPIGLMGNERLAEYPEVGTFTETGYDVTAAMWGLLVAPKGLDENVMTTLRQACADAQTTEAFKEGLAKLGMRPAYLDSDETSELIAREASESERVLEHLGFIN